MNIKTNVMRLLDEALISYEPKYYDSSITNGEEVALTLNEDKDSVFKTLVTTDNKHNYFVFVVPVNATLDLKKAAQAIKAKSIELIAQKELLPLTGYIHGGCSPIGMKKKFITVINDTASIFDYIFVSGGKVGVQIKINPLDLAKYIEAKFLDII